MWMKKLIKTIIALVIVFLLASLSAAAMVYLLHMLGIKKYTTFYAFGLMIAVVWGVRPKLVEWINKP